MGTKPGVSVKKIVFLDLEDTVIGVFGDAHNRTALNHNEVRSFLSREAPDEVRLFSFALSDACDVHRYRRDYQQWLDVSLGIRIQLENVFTTRMLFEMCRRWGTFYDDEAECMLFHGKALGFQRYIEMSAEFDDTEVVLLDDSVEPTLISYPKRNTHLRLVNVADLQASSK